MKVFKLHDLKDYKCLILIIDGLRAFSEADFPITMFDLSKVFGVRLIPSRYDKIKPSDTIQFKLADDIIVGVEYDVSIKLTAKGNISSIIVDKAKED